MAKILVTGSAGLIGSHLVDYLIKKGNKVYGVDNLSVGSKDNITQAAYQNFWHADLRQKKTTEFLMRIIKPDIIFHCAAWAHEGLAQFSPNLITENNLNIFLNTLIPAIRSGVKRFVVFSSVATYGDQEPPFTEETPTKPVDLYGLNKVFCEEAVKILSKVHDFEYTIVRAYNIFGERQSLTDPYRGVAAIFMNKLMHNEPFYIYGDGEQKRGFTYIKDVIPYIADCGFSPDAKNETFNIGGQNVYTVNELAKTIIEVSGKRIEPIYLPDRAQEVKIAYCDTSKAKRKLGLEETTSLKVAIENMWKWAKEKGPQEPKYLDYLELPSNKVPENWIKQK